MQGPLRLLTTGICFVVLTACWGEPITETQPNERQSATIEGIVREVGTETPIADVNVFVVRTSDQPQISTTTDSDGHFVLEGLDAGRHLVALLREGYVVPGRREISGYSFRVTTAQRITNTLFHMVPTGTVAGRIFDPEGLPASRVEVQLLQNLYVMGRQQWSIVNTGGSSRTARIETNEYGEFRVLGVDPGEYRIRFVPRELRVESVVPGGVAVAPMFYPGVRDVTKAAAVEVKPGRETLLDDITLRNEGRGWIRVTVVNRSGQSLEGFGSWRIGPPGWVGPEYALADEQIVNAYHQFQPDSSGTYEIVGMWSTPQGRLAGSARANYRGNDVNVTMPVNKPQGKLAGRVMLQDEEGKKSPLPGIEVAFGPSVSYFARSGPDGALLLPEVYAGTYQLGYLRGLPEDTFVLSVTQDARDAFREGILVPRGEAKLDVVISTRAGVVYGRVVDDGGRPVHNALLVLVPEPPLSNRTDYYGAYKDARTDQNGDFEIRGVTPGRYQIYAWNDAPATAYRNAAFMKPFAGKGKRVNVDLGERINVEVTAIPLEP
jgi:protocatechuate 3,4-dioxygenase beta subunit